MNKEEQTIDETTAANRDMPDDPTVTAQEQSSDAQTASEMDTATELEPASSSLNVLAEINQRLGVLQEFLEKPNAHKQETPPLQSESAQTDQRLTDLHELFDKQIARNQNQKQMFDTIYREMTGYKEDALLDAYHKPIIHNLIQLYDKLELVESELVKIDKTIESQFEIGNKTLELLEPLIESASGRELKRILSEELPQDVGQFREHLKEGLSQFRTQFQSVAKEALLQFQANLENVRYELEEVLYRMDVTPYEEHPEKLDPKLHKTFKAKQTADPDKDREVEEIHKTGFYWREKVFRPEEVTIFRYKLPTDKPEETVVENPTGEKGDATDG